MDRETFMLKALPLRPKLMAYATRMLDCRDDAEDVAQEVLLKLWSMKDELSAYGEIAPLSIQMTKYLCINILKAKRRTTVGMDVLDGHESPGYRVCSSQFC